MNTRWLLKRTRKLALALGSPLQLAALLRHGVLAGNEHRRVLRPDIRSVVDIGANRGQFALAARARLPAARIDSFEPLPAAAAKFRAVFSGDSRTRLHQVAIGARAERRPMNVSARDDASSLLMESELQKRHYPETGTVGVTEVQIVPLDHIIAPGTLLRPALLKIDVQGHEHETLLGSESVLPDFDYIYCECAYFELYRGQRLAEEIVAWLSARGFELAGTCNPDRDQDGRILQADFLFHARGVGR